MRLLGIDYGSKRVGLALTNEDGTMAFPKGVIPNDQKLVATITELVKTERVEKIIIGHSLNREGGANPIHAAVEALITDLTLEVGLPIELEPEQYTTQEATRIQGKNEATDASAAALILNSYITKHNEETHG